MAEDDRLRQAVLTVALLNLAYFGVEFWVALSIGSVSLLADSADFLEDASINLLIFFAVVWSAAARARTGMFLAGLLLVPAAAFLWSLYDKWLDPVPPAAFALTVTGAGALLVNMAAALVLARFRHRSGSLTRAAFLSARNDAAANLGIILAGLATAFAWRSAWPDVIVGTLIAAMNIDAAREVWTAARRERPARA